MILNLTDLSNEPLQAQISRQIREKILAGELISGISLPSIRALSREQRVSVITVQRAYEHLINDKLIHSRRGKGFFVSELLEDEKVAMAKKRLHNNIKPHILSSLAEGLRQDDIKKIINEILENNTS